MTIPIDRMPRIVLLAICVGLWAAAVPAFAQGIVDSALTRDLVSAGLLGVGAICQSLSLILFASMFERSWKIGKT